MRDSLYYLFRVEYRITSIWIIESCITILTWLILALPIPTEFIPAQLKGDTKRSLATCGLLWTGNIPVKEVFHLDIWLQHFCVYYLLHPPIFRSFNFVAGQEKELYIADWTTYIFFRVKSFSDTISLPNKGRGKVCVHPILIKLHLWEFSPDLTWGLHGYVVLD